MMNRRGLIQRAAFTAAAMTTPARAADPTEISYPVTARPVKAAQAARPALAARPARYCCRDGRTFLKVWNISGYWARPAHAPHFFT